MRVADYRIGLSSYNLPAVPDGELDQFIDELAARLAGEALLVGAEDGGDEENSFARYRDYG